LGKQQRTSSTNPKNGQQQVVEPNEAGQIAAEPGPRPGEQKHNPQANGLWFHPLDHKGGRIQDVADSSSQDDRQSRHVCVVVIRIDVNFRNKKRSFCTAAFSIQWNKYFNMIIRYFHLSSVSSSEYRMIGN
jgi:hypothetical protein